MPQPRYRVRTLLIATTLAAVVLACLSPWLRTLTESQWIGIVGRGVSLAIGYWIGTQVSFYIYRRYARRERAAQLGIKASCSKVQPEPILWFLAAFLLVAAVLGEVLVGDLFRSQRASGTYPPHLLMWMNWLNVGAWFGRCVVGWFGRHCPVYLTSRRLISPWSCHSWTRSFGCGWRDRAAGRLLFIVPFSYRLELSIAPENVNQVDRMLNPSEKTPPVVPPPPAT